MKPTVEMYSAKDWAGLAEKAHLICFKEHKPADIDRIDFSLIVRDEKFNLCGYITCREHDAETLYWQFGGTFPGTKGSFNSWVCYEACRDWARARSYKRITTLIENENTVMLKMAMKLGFRIFGIRFYNGKVLLEHALEFST